MRPKSHAIPLTFDQWPVHLYSEFVLLDLSPSVILWRRPLDLGPVRAPVGGLGLAGHGGNIKLVLGDSEVLCLQVGGVSVLIARSHKELVAFALDQVPQVPVEALGVAGGQPGTGGLVHLLDLVVADLLTSIILRHLPAEVTRLLGHLAHLERPHRDGGPAEDLDIDLDLVLAVLVLGAEAVLAHVGPLGGYEEQLGHVGAIGDLDVVPRLDLGSIELPDTLWSGLTWNIILT